MAVFLRALQKNKGPKPENSIIPKDLLRKSKGLRPGASVIT